MLIRRSNLNPGVIRQAREIIKNRLRKPGSDFSRVIKTWQFFEQDDVSDIDPTSWTVDMFPLFRVDIEGQAVSWRDEVTQKLHVDHVFTYAVEGNDPGDVSDLFEAIIPVFYPGDRSFFAQVKPLGVMAYSLKLAGITRQNFPDGRGQVARCILTLNTELRTQY